LGCREPTTTEVLSSILVRQDGIKELSADWDAGSHRITAETFTSDVATGTPPLVVASTTLVANFNASLLGGASKSAFALLAGRSGGQTLHGGIGAGDDLHFQTTSDATKGTHLFEEADAVELVSGASAMELRLREPSGGGASYVGFKSPALAATTVYTLPDADGGAGKFLQTDGSLVLSWGAAGGGGESTEETTTLTGTQNNFDADAAFTYLRCNNASALILTGFTTAGGAPTEGDRIIVHNIGSSTVRVADENAGSTVENRISTPSVRGQIIGTDGTIELVYDVTSSRWRIASINPGAFISITFSAGDFTTSGGTWTVQAGDISTYDYQQIGKVLFLRILLDGTSTSAGMGNQLRVAMPDSFTIAEKSSYIVYSEEPGGGSGKAASKLNAIVSVSTTFVFLQHMNESVWDSSTVNQTTIRAVGWIDVD